MTDEVLKPSLPIVVYCRSFDEQSGGTIVLHALVDRLRNLGVDAYAAPLVKQYPPSVSGIRRLLKDANQRRKISRFESHPSMDVPVATRELARRSIAVYPETISGNPLQAPHTVHWLLNKPGFFGKPLNIAESDAVFYFQDAFIDGVEGVSKDNLLRVRWLRHDIYFDRKLSERKGACRMLRKGSLKGSNAVPTDDTAIPLDGKSHEEIAEVFNITERFYCHDPYTMYCYYAALCGCIPIIVPEPGLTSSKWRASYANKFGIAYGEEEAEWASGTRQKLIAEVEAAQARETEGVRNFLKKVTHQFG